MPTHTPPTHSIHKHRKVSSLTYFEVPLYSRGERKLLVLKADRRIGPATAKKRKQRSALKTTIVPATAARDMHASTREILDCEYSDAFCIFAYEGRQQRRVGKKPHGGRAMAAPNHHPFPPRIHRAASFRGGFDGRTPSFPGLEASKQCRCCFRLWQEAHLLVATAHISHHRRIAFPSHRQPSTLTPRTLISNQLLQKRAGRWREGYAQPQPAVPRLRQSVTRVRIIIRY